MMRERAVRRDRAPARRRRPRRGALGPARRGGGARPAASVRRSASEAAVLVFELEDPGRAADELEEALGREGITALVAPTTAARTGAPLRRDRRRRRRPRRGRRRRAGRARARPRPRPRRRQPGRAPRRPSTAPSTRRAARSRRRRSQNGDAPEVASHRDLGAFTLLLALQDDEALRLYSESLLAPIESTEGEYGGRAPALARGLHRAERPVGAGRPASSTAIATRCATGSAGSRSSPAAT